MLKRLAALAVVAIVCAACGSAAKRAAEPATARPSSTTTTATTTTATTSTFPPAPTTAPPTTSVAPTTTSTAGCEQNLADQLSTTDGAGQLITVVADSYGTTYATLTAWVRKGSCYVAVFGPFEARVGRSGLAPASSKREGDGRTPEGIYGFGPVMYGNAEDPGVHYQYVHLICGDWWDEDPVSPDYNLFEVEPCGVTPSFAQGADGAGSEALWTETVPYPSFAYIEYNLARTPWVGSAIFFAATTGYPTAGCVAIAQPALDEVLDWLAFGQDPRIVIGTSADIGTY